MKKLSLLVIFLIATCTVSMAQPRAVGGRLGWSFGPSYQHQIGEKNMIQTDVDVIGWGLWGIQGTATFNWIIPLVSANAGNLNLYPGVGLGVGFEWWRRNYVYHWSYPPYMYDPWPLPHHLGRGTFVGIAGMIGLEWNFKFPLQLAFEYRPVIGPKFYRTYDSSDGYIGSPFPLNPPPYDKIGVAYYYHGLWASAVAISVRYKFGGK
ncbi:MAG: hypothetical protein FWD09_08865 [Lentimicrobiaceae bacterium]|nr:hypothetical protein [Lentimicrobiaceae bacterium]